MGHLVWWKTEGGGAEAGPGGLKMASKVPARLNSSMMTYFRASCEQEPVVMFSCVLGGIDLLMPFFFADGGRSVEEANTSFGYRIKHVYPKSMGAKVEE